MVKIQAHSIAQHDQVPIGDKPIRHFKQGLPGVFRFAGLRWRGVALHQQPSDLFKIPPVHVLDAVRRPANREVRAESGKARFPVVGIGTFSCLRIRHRALRKGGSQCRSTRGCYARVIQRHSLEARHGLEMFHAAIADPCAVEMQLFQAASPTRFDPLGLAADSQECSARRSKPACEALPIDAPPTARAAAFATKRRTFARLRPPRRARWPHPSARQSGRRRPNSPAKTPASLRRYRRRRAVGQD